MLFDKVIDAIEGFNINSVKENRKIFLDPLISYIQNKKKLNEAIQLILFARTILEEVIWLRFGLKLVPGFLMCLRWFAILEEQKQQNYIGL